ncbi:MAG: radical SAM family heme chaperone HemW [Lachnospiraceae bacterium]|nr:radical SAM family heme chaperone HemW [Lachnospiraceae bacterium]
MINNDMENSGMENIGKIMSLYVHIPFCVRKCNYCDFLSSPASEEMKEQYVQALIHEMEEKREIYQAYQVESVFIGGGTPSTLSTEQMSRLLGTMQNCYRILRDAEFTVEINPGTVDREKLVAYKTHGVNRLSIGLQSADDGELCRLGRIHTFDEFMETFQTARELGYENINIDLMSGLPGQSRESYRQTLEKVLALKPEHLSAYSLIVEEGTPFWDLYGEGSQENGSGERNIHTEEKPDTEESHDLSLPDEDTDRMMYEDTDRILAEQGYHRYEISNYARTGYESRHNTGYWKRHNYLGLGLGSSSLIDNCRWKNESVLAAYVNQNGICEKKEQETLTTQEQMEEFMFLGLRLMRGISYQEFDNYFHRPIMEVYAAPIQKGIAEGLLMEVEEGGETCLRLTKRGIDVSNVVMSDFLF